MRNSLFVALNAACLLGLASAAHAQELVVKNDNLPAIDPDTPWSGSIGLNSNFDANEKGAAVFTIPAAYRPAVIKRVQILWHSATGVTGNSIQEAIEVWRGSPLQASPVSSKIFDSLNADPDGFSPQLTDGYLNEYDLSSFNIIVPDTYTRFTVALVFASNTSAPAGPTIAVDLNGIQAGRNAVYGTIPPIINTAQWFDAATVGLQGDFIIRAVIDKAPVPVTRCSPADIADGVGNPLPGSGFNPGVDGGDFDCFFNYYFEPAPTNSVCDIANGVGDPLPPFGPSGTFNPGVDGGDFDCFFNYYFSGCL